MAITRGATVTVGVDSATPIIATLAHTVDASTTLLLVSFHCEGDLGISAVNWNTSEAMTLVSSVTTSAAGGDCRVYVFGRINPTVTAANVTWTVADVGDNLAVVAVNYLGTETASVAAATNEINTNDNGNAAATTVPLTGATTNGSTLFAAGTFFGGDGNPSSDSTASFTTLREGETGTSTTADTCYYTGEKIAGGTGGTVSPTIDWTGAISDECVGVFIELLEPPAALALHSVPIEYPQPDRRLWDSEAQDFVATNLYPLYKLLDSPFFVQQVPSYIEQKFYDQIDLLPTFQPFQDKPHGQFTDSEQIRVKAQLDHDQFLNFALLASGDSPFIPGEFTQPDRRKWGIPVQDFPSTNLYPLYQIIDAPFVLFDFPQPNRAKFYDQIDLLPTFQPFQDKPRRMMGQVLT